VYIYTNIYLTRPWAPSNRFQNLPNRCIYASFRLAVVAAVLGDPLLRHRPVQCMRAHTHTHMHKHIHMHMHISTHESIATVLQDPIKSKTHTHTNTHMHTPAHTNTHLHCIWVNRTHTKQRKLILQVKKQSSLHLHYILHVYSYMHVQLFICMDVYSFSTLWAIHRPILPSTLPDIGTVYSQWVAVSCSELQWVVVSNTQKSSRIRVNIYFLRNVKHSAKNVYPCIRQQCKSIPFFFEDFFFFAILNSIPHPKIWTTFEVTNRLINRALFKLAQLFSHRTGSFYIGYFLY